MSEGWQSVPIESEEDSVTMVNDLTARPDLSHSEFIGSIDHLREARMRHAHLLATAGIEAEEHIGNINPEMQLDWIVESMNGRRHGNGLTIPMLGTSPEDIEILSDLNSVEPRIRIEVLSHGFSQTIPLPESVKTISAIFSNGNLSIEW